MGDDQAYMEVEMDEPGAKHLRVSIRIRARVDTEADILAVVSAINTLAPQAERAIRGALAANWGDSLVLSYPLSTGEFVPVSMGVGIVSSTTECRNSCSEYADRQADSAAWFGVTAHDDAETGG